MKRKKLITIYLEQDEESDMLHVKCADEMNLREQLGILEWAKMILFEGVKTENALSEYAQEEV